tara:strand:- start:1275 stop:1622 length:348 start_codon:yes stop_codon:yes gene_type:complete
MSKNYQEIIENLYDSMGRLNKGLPDVMGGYVTMSAAAKKAGALDVKAKELIAIAISVANRCDGCIAAHTNAAVKHGVSREELLETLGIAIYMGGGPSTVYAAQVLDAFDQFASAN